MVESILLLIYLAVLVLCIAAGWKIFEKANQPGWGILVPIYNMVLMIKIAGKPTWWVILFFLPIISLIPSILVPLAIAKNFRKGVGFGIGLIFLPFIYGPILGFGDAQYDPVDVPAF